MAERVFFLDDSRSFCSVVLLPPGPDVHFSRLKTLIKMLVADPALRNQYRRELCFPLQRHYSDYGAFLEEASR